MSPDQHKALVREHYRAFHEGDGAAIDRQVSPAFIDHDAPPGAGPGPDAVKAWRTALYAAFPDLRLSLDEIVAERDVVAVRATWHGTHRGEFMRLPPTGRPVTMTGMVFWRIAGGQLVERWATIDRLGLLQQLQQAATPRPA